MDIQGASGRGVKDLVWDVGGEGRERPVNWKMQIWNARGIF